MSGQWEVISEARLAPMRGGACDMKIIDPILNAFERFAETDIGRSITGVLIIATGVILTWIGGEEFWAMTHDIASAAPVVTVTSTSIDGPLIGPPLVLIGALLMIGKALWIAPKIRDILAATTIGYMLVCIVIYPFSSPILRAVTASILEARGYVAGDIESTSPTSRLWTIKWTRRISTDKPKS